jgi:hypothetical protein
VLPLKIKELQVSCNSFCVYATKNATINGLKKETGQHTKERKVLIHKMLAHAL